MSIDQQQHLGRRETPGDQAEGLVWLDSIAR